MKKRGSGGFTSSCPRSSRVRTLPASTVRLLKIRDLYLGLPSPRHASFVNVLTSRLSFQLFTQYRGYLLTECIFCRARSLGCQQVRYVYRYCTVLVLVHTVSVTYRYVLQNKKWRRPNHSKFASICERTLTDPNYGICPTQKTKESNAQHPTQNATPNNPRHNGRRSVKARLLTPLSDLQDD
jgi:hypothetical protein